VKQTSSLDYEKDAKGPNVSGKENSGQCQVARRDRSTSGGRREVAIDSRVRYRFLKNERNTRPIRDKWARRQNKKRRRISRA